MRITFGDLRIGKTAQKNLQTVMDTNWASEGPMVRDFEKNWNDLFGYTDSVSMSSGTDACINACLVLYDRGAKRGDEIICPALTFVATVNSIVLAGFTPKFVDIDRNTLNIDPNKIQDVITDKTRGIIVTHTMGKPCDMNAVMSIANEKDLFVMEDACLVPGQNIVTELGIKKIEDIQTGNKVYTHTGKFCKVLNTMNRNYDGDIIDIYTYGQNAHLQVTPEHQVFAVKTENILNNKSKKWFAATDIKESDYLVLPRYNNMDDLDHLDLSCYDHRSKNAKYQSLFESRYKEKISVNSDLMVVIGWYLAEGWCYRQHVEFSLCKDEIENIENLCYSIESLDFEYEIQDRNVNSKCVNICIFSKQFKSFLKNNFGTGAKDKKIPTWVLDLSLSKIETLLDAYVKGDGNKVKDRQEQYSVTSISLDLLESIRLICSKLGYYAGITQSASAGISEICGRKVNVSDKYQLRFSKQRLNKIDRRTCIDDQYIYYRVKSIETKKYVGQVFNLEVDKDNSYCGIGWAMHNCEAHGAKIGDKYIGKFGHVAMFSFYTAHIVVAGEGGMCSTMYPEVADILRSTKSHGRKPGSAYFEFLRIGLNSKMNDLEAAVGLEGVEQFHQTIEKRVANRKVLMDLLENLQEELWLPNLGTDEFVSPHAFPVVFRKNNPEKCTELYSYLEKNSIQCKTLFGSMPTQHKAFEYLGHKIGDFPEAEFVGDNGLHFGIHQYLTEDDMTYISDTIHKFFG